MGLLPENPEMVFCAEVMVEVSGAAIVAWFLVFQTWLHIGVSVIKAK